MPADGFDIWIQYFSSEDLLSSPTSEIGLISSLRWCGLTYWSSYYLQLHLSDTDSYGELDKDSYR